MNKKQQKLKPFLVRLHKRQQTGIKKLAKRNKVSEAHIVRIAIDEFLTNAGL